MKRRLFLQQSMLLGSGLALSPSLLAGEKIPIDFKKLTILHTNDTHSNIETFPANHAKYPNQGGVARRSTLIEKIRKESEHLLLLDAGDIFQGTPYFNKFRGTLEMKLMSELGYDCATLGNHDFDAGLEGLVNAMQYANFPIVCANYDFKNTPLQGKIDPYQIIQKGPFKIGVFGLGVRLQGLVPQVYFGETVHLEPFPIARKMANHLRFEEECDLVICLSHLGYHAKQFKECDTLLAKETENIDLIIGGHTHTFLDRPEVHKNTKGEKVLINQVGWAGLALGKIDFYLGERKRHERHELIMV
jgi:5'-nucleotidase